MLNVFTVCTGNICRSPFAQVVLQDEFGGEALHVASAGVRAMIDSPMTTETGQLANGYGVDPDLIAAHRARWLNENLLGDQHLVLAMTREHRKAIVELAPAKVRSTFTLREFERLAAVVTDDTAARVADEAGDESDARLRALLTHLAGVRGELDPPVDLSVDDVVDPYRRDWDKYELMATQMMPALGQVSRMLTHALRR